MTDFKYKTDHNLEERKQEANRILNEYSNRIPIICERAPNSKLPSINKSKYLVPGDMTISQFQFIIRKQLDLNENYALYLLTNKGVSLVGNITIRQIYINYKDKQDDFLYLYYESELTWG